jgi:DNA polymerase-2
MTACGRISSCARATLTVSVPHRRARGSASRVDDVRRRTGGPVELTLPGEVPPVRRRLDDIGVECFEADIRFAYRYMIDQGIRGSVEVDGPHERHERLGLVYRNPTLRPVLWKPALRVLSIDIETSMKGDRVFAIALHGCGQSKSLLVHHDRTLAQAEVVPNEHALLSRFLGYLDALDPDVITGWNVVDFDLAVLARAAHRHGLRFVVGRTDDEFDRQRDPSFTRESRAVLYGRLVLDGLALLRGAFIRLDDYRLETAAQEFLGRGKLITGANRHLEIERQYREDPQSW